MAKQANGGWVKIAGIVIVLTSALAAGAYGYGQLSQVVSANQLAIGDNRDQIAKRDERDIEFRESIVRQLGEIAANQNTLLERWK